MFNIYSHGSRKNKIIAITFDDGPAQETLAILDVLERYNAKATFFIVGKMIKGNEDIINVTKSKGHEFGNHTFSHKRLWFKSYNFAKQDIIDCDNELRRVGIETELFRFPGLKYGFNALRACRDLGKKIVSVEFVSINQFAYDWFAPWLRKIGLLKSDMHINTVVNKTLQNVKNGSILGFHDYLQGIGPHPEIVTILEGLLPQLQARGFSFVTVSELVKYKD